MSSLTFKEKVESGQFDIKTMNSMIIQFENQIYDNQVKADNKPELQTKIKVIKDYLHKLCSTPTSPKTDDTLGNKTHTTSSKTITLNTGKKITHDRSVTDADVARKFLQVEDSARKRGIEFSLNLTTVKNLMKAKKCVNDLKNVLIEHPSSVFKGNPSLLLKAVEQWILPEVENN